MSTHRETARLTNSNKSWLVKLVRRRKRLILTCGWGKFVADNTLQVGDVCRFELLRGNDYKFRVAILRGNGTSSRREAGKSKEMIVLNSREEGSKRTVEANVVPALEDASAKFISKHPFFQIVLSPTYVSKGFLNIPSNFRKSYMNECRATARLHHSNKLWLVNLKGYDNRGFKFCGGWRKFVKENSLQVGDACCFELIEKEKYVFKVSIARGDD